jgi:hypothetical protein
MILLSASCCECPKRIPVQEYEVSHVSEATLPRLSPGPRTRLGSVSRPGALRRREPRLQQRHLTWRLLRTMPALPGPSRRGSEFGGANWGARSATRLDAETGDGKTRRLPMNQPGAVAVEMLEQALRSAAGIRSEVARVWRGLSSRRGPDIGREETPYARCFSDQSPKPRP